MCADNLLFLNVTFYGVVKYKEQIFGSAYLLLSFTAYTACVGR